jgi:hypothetical protein
MRKLTICIALATAILAATHAHGQALDASAASPAELTCSPAPCVLPPTLASEGTILVTDTPIASNPLDQDTLLLGGDDWNCTTADVGFHLSTDRGSEWELVECMPGLPLGKRYYTAVDEPSVGYDLKGNAYVSAIYGYSTEEAYYGLVAVQKSSNGTSWGKPRVALLQPGVTNFFLTHLTVDASASSPWANSVYVSGILVSHSGYDNQVWVSHSNDGGTTWKQVAVDTVQKYPKGDAFTRTAVGKDGTVYVTWLGGRGPSCPVMLSRSSDGGNTWSIPAQIARVQTVDGLPHTFERVYDYPSIAVDNSDGPYAGNIYVVMYTWTGSYLKVQMIRSTDGGTTWSKPLRLAPKTDTHDQFFPAISVSQHGLVGVSWLDRRNDPNDIDYQAFAAISHDGGKSFGPNWQLTTAFSDPEKGSGNDWMGDYTGNTWSGDSEFIAAWMDSSFSTYLQEAVGGVRLK